jgi:histidinol-phosphate aminotransferase
LKNTEAKQHIYNTLDSLGLSYIPSHTNFVFFKTGKPIREVITQMQAENVLIGRPFPPMDTWARISTGTMQEMELFSKGLKNVMS